MFIFNYVYFYEYIEIYACKVRGAWRSEEGIGSLGSGVFR